MDAALLIADLSRRGIRLVAEGTQLAAEPASLLSDADRAQIRTHKAELLRLLSGASGSEQTAGGLPDPESEIARIEQRARSLGWHPAQLWCPHFWPHPRGLAALLDAGDRLTSVEKNCITIVKADGSIQRFRRERGPGGADGGTRCETSLDGIDVSLHSPSTAFMPEK